MTGALCWWVGAHQSSWGLMGHDFGGLPVWWGGRLRWQGPPAQRGGLFKDLCSGPKRSSSRGGGWPDRLGRRWACRGLGSLVTEAPTLCEQESSQTSPPHVSCLLMQDRYPQTWQLRATHADYLTAPVGQEFGHSLLCPSAQGLPRLQSRSRPGCIRSGAQSPVPSSRGCWWRSRPAVAGLNIFLLAVSWAALILCHATPHRPSRTWQLAFARPAGVCLTSRPTFPGLT